MISASTGGVGGAEAAKSSSQQRRQGRPAGAVRSTWNFCRYSRQAVSWGVLARYREGMLLLPEACDVSMRLRLAPSSNTCSGPDDAEFDRAKRNERRGVHKRNAIRDDLSPRETSVWGKLKN